MSLDCDSLPSHSTREDLCIEPPGEHDNFPGDQRDLDAADDLRHDAAGTTLPVNDTASCIVTSATEAELVSSFCLSVISQPSIYIDGWLYAMSMTSVVCNVPVLSQNDSTYHHSVFTT